MHPCALKLINSLCSFNLWCLKRRTVFHGDLLLGHRGGEGVGPEALQGSCLGRLLFALGCVWGAGVQHRLKDPSSSVNKPGDIEPIRGDPDDYTDPTYVYSVITHQLLTCSSVRLVCRAICFFSSSVGYGCCEGQKQGGLTTSLYLRVSVFLLFIC